MRLVWFPVNEPELPSVEALLGVALPTRYKAALLDRRVREILAHSSASSFWPGMSMAEFVEFTTVFRAQHPELPPGAVVAAAVVDHETGRPVLSQGYWRIWLPENSNPALLAPVQYSWNVATRRKTRDCSVDAWVETVVRVVASADPAFLDTLGFPQPAPERAEKPLFSVVPLRLDRDGAWADCGVLELRGPAWCVCDGATSPAASGLPAVRVPPGSYVVQVAGNWVVSAVRLVLQGARVHTVRRESQVDVDHAVVALHDRAAFLKAVPSSQRARAEDELLALSSAPCLVDVRGRTRFVRVPSGRGDGTYPVNVLLDEAGAAVGVEVVFSAGA